MNALITYLISRHESLNGKLEFALCLPGIADDGYLQFSSYFFNPYIGILFAGVQKEDCEDFNEKIKSIANYLEEYKFVLQILKSIQKNHALTSSILSSTLPSLPLRRI